MELRRAGWIEVICGSMFSGKTEELLRRVRRAKIAKHDVLLVKPKMDNRYSENSVVTHEGIEHIALPLSTSQEILTSIQDQSIVAIDEAQFFDNDLPKVVAQLANKGIRVIVAGLDMDFQGRPFGPMPEILAMAEYVKKTHAICVKCGQLAHFSFRTTGSDSQVELGAIDKYQALCRSCYKESNK